MLAALLVWSLFLFLALVSIINLLQITYYSVIHRISFIMTIHIVLISDQIDSALVILFATMSSFFAFLNFQRLGNKWLALSPLIILNLSALLALLGAFDLALVLIAIGVSSYVLLVARILRQTIALAEALAAILCILEAGALINWLLYPLALPSQVSALFSRFSSIETQLFYAPADLTPIAMLILLFSFPIFYIAKRLGRETEAMRCDIKFRIDGRLLLVVATLLTALVASYPYLPSINPTGKQVGTDVYYYTQWLNEMEGNPNQAIEIAIHHISSRPLFLLLLYYLKLYLHVPMIPLLEWMAVPFFCLLTISVYTFCEVVNGRTFAGLAALLSSFSINIVAGMYTAYYSNVLALSLLYFALAILLLSLRRMSYVLALLSSTLSIVAIFIHPWSWAFVLAALCLFVGTKVLRAGFISRDRVIAELRQLGPVLVFITTNAMASSLEALLLAVPGGVGVSYEFASASISIKEFFNLGFNLYFTFRFFAGGYFNNLSAIISAIIGTWWLMKQKERSRDALLAWLTLGSVPTLFVNFWVNERIFFNLPIQVFSAAGLWFILSAPSFKRRRTLPVMLLLLFVLLNLSYSLRSMVNLV